MKPFTVQFENLRADNLHVSFQLQENNSDANEEKDIRRFRANADTVSAFLLIRELS